MKTISIRNTQDTIRDPAISFNPALIDSFISWIDRSEKTSRTYLTNLKQFAAWMKYAGIENPCRQDILSYRQWLNTEHFRIALDHRQPAGWTYKTDKAGRPLETICRPNTTAQYLRSVCQFFRWTAAAGLYPDVSSNIHAPKIRHDTHRKEALSIEEVSKVERSISENAERRALLAQEAQKDTAGRIQRSAEQSKRIRAIYLLAVNAGLRTIEISRANIKDFETKDGKSYLYIWGKGHAEPDQRKAIAPEVAEAVQEYISSRTDNPTGSSPLFVSTGNRSGGKRIASTTISAMIKAALKEAGFNSERITAHSLRHTAGTAIQELTGNLYATQKYMRHSNPATTEIYLHTNAEEAEAEIAQDLYNLYHGKKNVEDLNGIICRMNQQQIKQLTGIAAAMIKA